MVMAGELRGDRSDSRIARSSSSRNSGANVFFNEASPKFAAQAIRKAAEIGWRPAQYLANVSASVNSVLRPAGIEASQGVITAAYLKDPTDWQWEGTPDFVAWKAWYACRHIIPMAILRTPSTSMPMRSLQPDAAWFCNEVRDELTRANVMQQAASMHDLDVPMPAPGIKINTSATDFYPIQSVRLQRFKGETWELFGDVRSQRKHLIARGFSAGEGHQQVRRRPSGHHKGLSDVFGDFTVRATSRTKDGSISAITAAAGSSSTAEALNEYLDVNTPFSSCGSSVLTQPCLCRTTTSQADDQSLGTRRASANTMHKRSESKKFSRVRPSQVSGELCRQRPAAGLRACRSRPQGMRREQENLRHAGLLARPAEGARRSVPAGQTGRMRPQSGGPGPPVCAAGSCAAANSKPASPSQQRFDALG